jgi:putative ABC transport system permease protein
MPDAGREFSRKPHLWLIALVGVIVPRRLRADWRQEWEAELRWREATLQDWDRLDWRNKLDLLRRSASALWDALLLQPRRWEDEMLQDIRFGARALLKGPGFTLAVVLTLALGIGANAAIFSVFNGVILRPLIYKNPDRMVSLRKSARRGMRYQPGMSADSSFGSGGPGVFHDWRERSRSFEDVTAYRTNSTIFTDNRLTVYAVTIRVAERFFETYGVTARLGRTFSEQDYLPGAPPVIILANDLWQSQYGADPRIIGRVISLDGEPRTVVGVAPMGFWPVSSGAPPLVWTPYPFNAGEKTDRKTGRWNVIARLRAGVTFDQAQAEMDGVAAQLESNYPEDYKNRGVALIPIDADLNESLGGFRRVFTLLLLAVGLVLAVACVNVANLLLARATDREREFAVRAALGAGRRRIFRQLLTESMLLATAGGAVGLLLGAGGMRLLAALLTRVSQTPRLEELKFDWRAFAFTAAVTLATGVLFGSVPAVRAARSDLRNALAEGGSGAGTGRGRRRLRNLLVIGEVALAAPLLVGAGLIVQSFVRLEGVDPGFRPNRLLTMRVNVPDYKYGHYLRGSKTGSPEMESRVKLFHRIEERLNMLPGVESAAVAGRLPVQDGPYPEGFSVEGRSANGGDIPAEKLSDCEEFRLKTGLNCHGAAGVNSVTPAYFRTLGLTLLRGRLFDERDTAGAPMVALVSEAAARKYWPNENPVGKRFTLDFTSWFPRAEIIGVVSDIKTDEIDKPPFPEIYRPMSQFPSDDGQLILRSKGDPGALSAVVTAEMTRIDPDMPVRNIKTMEGVIGDSLWRARIAAWLMSLFGALAAALAAAGLYGVMNYSVSQRAREIGLRMALGAGPGRVSRMVIREGAVLLGSGLAAGLVIAIALSRFLASQLFGVTATDPLTYAAVAALLAAAAMAACYLPARKAARVDPMVSLRHE